MRILVAVANALDRRKLCSLLSTADNEVQEAADLAAVHETIAVADLDVIVVDWALATATCAAGATSIPPPYIIVVQSHWTSKDIAAAYASGAHDFMKLTAYDAELLGRVNGFKRMRSWKGERTQEAVPSVDLSQMPAWRALESLLTDEIGVLIGTPLRRSPRDSYAVTHASQISLVLATEHVEVRLSVGADAAACSTLAGMLLGGDTSSAAIADALREMANTIGGALKRAAFADGTVFTLGLPRDGGLFSDAAEMRRWHATNGDGLCLAFAAKVIVTTSRRLPMSGLREGMVLVRDLKNPAGVLLASAGTMLTRSTAERLCALAGTGLRIDVLDAVTT